MGDGKEHTAPYGEYQTGIPFDKNRKTDLNSGKNKNTVEFIGYNVTDMEIDGASKSSINITNNYIFIGIIVYDDVYNYK